MPSYFGIIDQLDGVLNPSKVPQYQEARVVFLRIFLLRALLGGFSKLVILTHQVLHEFLAWYNGKAFTLVYSFLQTIRRHCLYENCIDRILTCVSCSALGNVASPVVLDYFSLYCYRAWGIRFIFPCVTCLQVWVGVCCSK